ncbi:MAG TPA: FkbM family methyltransferase [Candidatus Acidoferrum sp.]|nr:FkbM family methyltransferase [Candidatus Acidoferrum sp.]
MTATQKTERYGLVPRAWRFIQKPWHEKANHLEHRWNRFVSAIPVPFRLPFGAWWIRENDNLSEPLRTKNFEHDELSFVQRYLRPGMTVLDVGAHHGLYTLLASKLVGSSGRVFSFEPSPRERRKLRLHIAFNLCRNVTVQALALGSQEASADLFVVQGAQTGCNSLRPPDVVSGTAPLPVRVSTLDGWLQTAGLNRVDFVKLDVEGAELEVLKGAAKLLDQSARPVILAEVQDVRTAPWGYRAKEILKHLNDAGYVWFRLLPGGSLQELDLSPGSFDGNFVACPRESTAALRSFLSPCP